MRDLARLPKAHLHVHLENAIRWPTLTEIGAANGVAVPEAATTAFDDFGGFADHNTLIRNCLCRAEDFARIAEELCRDEAANGTAYVEVTFTAAGLAVTLNADIPTIVGTSLTEEFRRARHTFGFDDATLAELAVAGIDASFAPELTRRRLHEGAASWLAGTA